MSCHDGSYLQRPQYYSLPSSTIGDISARISKLTIRRGKSVNPSRFLPTFSRVSRPRSLVICSSSRTTAEDTCSSSCQRFNGNANNPDRYIHNHLDNNIPTYDSLNQPRGLFVKPTSSMLSNNNSLPVNKNNMNVHNMNTVQLLHPHWRKVPWHQQFGWTDTHQRHCEWLQQQVRTGMVASIFYNSPEEYEIVEKIHRGSLLPGPSVNTVADVLDVIRRTHYCRQQQYRLRIYKSRLPEYDADVEDVTVSSSD